jgi:excinuclease ABC subunit A
LRIIYAQIGICHCPLCHLPLPIFTVPEIVHEILTLPKGERIILLAPILAKKKRESWWKKYLKEGFTKIKINDHLYDISEQIPPVEGEKIEIVVDRLIVKDGIKKRLRDSVELTLRLTGRMIAVEIPGKKKLFFGQKTSCPKCGFHFDQLSAALFSFNSPLGACHLCQGLGQKGEKICSLCQGKRLRSEALAVKINGEDIAFVANLPLERLIGFLKSINLTQRQKLIASPILEEIEKRINQLLEMKLGYLCLNRNITNVSTGEYQRLMLSLYLSNALSNVIFVLDEPTTGLHPSEVNDLILALKQLKTLGNTVIVIEHDLEVILNADCLLELGPISGDGGGEIIFMGPPKGLKEAKTITGQYILGQKVITRPKRLATENYLLIEGASANNLKHISVSIPLNRLTCICGPSGSGKSSLIINVLYHYLKKRLAQKEVSSIKVVDIKGIEKIKHVVLIDANPIGKTTRSNPATYIGVFTYIRQLFAQLPEARARGYTAERFSLNTKGGRCEVCKGEGIVKVEMPILADLFITCEACQGRRFNNDTLEIVFKGKNIAEILDTNIIKTYELFRYIPLIKKYLKVLIEVGLGYLKLGQPAPSLSGGEAQRLKLARELTLGQKQTLYLLDEPSIGLHLEDLSHLLAFLDKLIEKGNTIVIAEHHPKIIEIADYLIELGPAGGEKGGYLIKSGWAYNTAAEDVTQ